jgi:hypothetical protein
MAETHSRSRRLWSVQFLVDAYMERCFRQLLKNQISLSIHSGLIPCFTAPMRTPREQVKHDIATFRADSPDLSVAIDQLFRAKDLVVAVTTNLGTPEKGDHPIM